MNLSRKELLILTIAMLISSSHQYLKETNKEHDPIFDLQGNPMLYNDKEPVKLKMPDHGTFIECENSDKNIDNRVMEWWPNPDYAGYVKGKLMMFFGWTYLEWPNSVIAYYGSELKPRLVRSMYSKQEGQKNAVSIIERTVTEFLKVGYTTLDDFNKVPYVKLNEKDLPNIIVFKNYRKQIKKDVILDQRTNEDSWKVNLDSLNYEAFHEKFYRHEALTSMFMTMKLPENSKFNREKLAIYQANPDIEENIKTNSASVWENRSNVLIPLYQELFTKNYLAFGLEISNAAFILFKLGLISEAFNQDDDKVVNLQTLKDKAVQTKMSAWNILNFKVMNASFIDNNDFHSMIYGVDDDIETALYSNIQKALSVEYLDYFPQNSPFVRKSNGEDIPYKKSFKDINLTQFKIFYKLHEAQILGAYVERYMTIVQNMDMLKNAQIADLSVKKNFLAFKMYLMINGYLNVNLKRDSDQMGTMDFEWMGAIVDYDILI